MSAGVKSNPSHASTYGRVLGGMGTLEEAKFSREATTLE